jgi:hypothetical protein
VSGAGLEAWRSNSYRSRLGTGYGGVRSYCTSVVLQVLCASRVQSRRWPTAAACRRHFRRRAPLSNTGSPPIKKTLALRGVVDVANAEISPQRLRSRSEISPCHIAPECRSGSFASSFSASAASFLSHPSNRLVPQFFSVRVFASVPRRE